jgi:hypothetical protein
VRWAGLVVRAREKKERKRFGGKPQKIQLERVGLIWKHNIKINLKEIECEDPAYGEMMGC